MSGNSHDRCDVLVVGSGGAGMSATLAARGAGSSVVLATKSALGASNTSRAQGGIQAAVGAGDTIASHCKFRDKYQLTFPLLSDADTKMMEKYGAWGEKVLYGKKSLGVIRSTVLIGKDGKVVKHWPKVLAKGHADKVVEAVQEAVKAEP